MSNHNPFEFNHQDPKTKGDIRFDKIIVAIIVLGLVLAAVHGNLW